MSNFKKLFIFTLVVIFFIGCGNQEKLSNRKIKTLNVNVAAIKLKSIPVFQNVDGFISSDKIAFISPKINGYIEKFYIKTGDRVKKGELLFKIKNREIEEKVKSLNFKLKALKLQQKEIKILISISKKSLVQAQANYKLAKKNFQRFKNLLKTESITPQEFDKIKTEYINSKMELKKAKDMLQINRLKLTQIKNQIKSLRSSLKELEVVSGYRFVRAPFNGVVLDKYIDEGNLVSPGVKVLKLGSLEKVAYFSVPLKYKQNILSSRFIKIKNFNAKILEVSPDIKRSTSQFTVKTEIPFNSNYENGEYVKGKIYTGNKKAIILDAKYVRKFNDIYYTFICKDGFVVKSFLTGFFINKNQFLVKSGLVPGDKLIISPLKDFDENLRCRIQNES